MIRRLVLLRRVGDQACKDSVRLRRGFCRPRDLTRRLLLLAVGLCMLGTLPAADFQALEKTVAQVPTLGKNKPEISRPWKNDGENFQPSLARQAALGCQPFEKTNTPWWHTLTPLASVGLGAPNLVTIQPGAARGAGTYGWYGCWYFDEVEKNNVYKTTRAKLAQAGVKQVIYYDLGEVGDYAAFFAADGRMVQSGWSLPWWDGKTPLMALPGPGVMAGICRTGSWFALDAKR